MPKHDEPEEVPEGAALFPMIPAELGVHPLLLGLVHAYVFLEGSTSEVVNDAAAGEALEYLATYLQRLEGKDLLRVQEDLETLVSHGKQEKWPKAAIEFLKAFLVENGVSGAGAGPEDDTEIENEDS